MLSQSTELVTYSTATKLATEYQARTARIKELAIELGEQMEALSSLYQDPWTFQLQLSYRGYQQYKPVEQDIDKIIRRIKCGAWSALIKKLGIEKLMSTKRIEELREIAELGASHYTNEKADELPEITPETIMEVLQGYINSAAEFMDEKLIEIGEWLKPQRSKLKTNSDWKIGMKCIVSRVVRRSYGGGWAVEYDASPYVTALDSILHWLDGKGILSTNRGPIHEAVQLCGMDGYGETEYVRFRCCGNGNLHITFKRADLIERFNQIISKGDRIGSWK